MNCAEAVEHLWESATGGVDHDTAGSVARHLRECDACRREALRIRALESMLDSMSPDDLAGSIGDAATTDHLDEAQFVSLIRSRNGAIGEEERAGWLHVLECSRCYAACARLIQAEAPGPDYERMAAALAAVREAEMAAYAQTVVVALVWVGHKLTMQARAQRAPARGSGDEWYTDVRLGEYDVKFQASPHSTAGRDCVLELLVKAGREVPQPESIRAELRRAADGGVVHALSAIDGRVRFPPLPIGGYRIDLLVDQRPVGSIDVPITEAPT